MFLKPYTMKKSLIILLLVFGVVTLVGAQENNSEVSSTEDCTYQKFKFSLNFGRSNPNMMYLPSFSSTITPVVPSVSGVSESYNDATNMIGVEFRYMFKKNWSLNLTGLGYLESNPSTDAIQGVYDNDLGQIIPNVNSVPYNADYSWNAEIGVSRYFDLPNKKLLPYAGVSFIVSQRNLIYESVLDVTGEEPLDPNYMDLQGERNAEGVSWGFALPIGAEYKVAEGLFIGMSINAANYFYSYSSYRPGEGMELATAQNVTTSFFTRPMLKLGIEF
jgi:outer membrane protein W